MDKTTKIICNQCGKILPEENGILREDCIKVEKSWGYFSSKDGVDYRFTLCESCCDKLVKGFVVPVKITDTRELL